MRLVKAILTVARDAILLILGSGGIAYQQWKNEVNLPLLVAYMAMLGLPGAISLYQLTGRGNPETPPTPSPSSSSPSPSSQQPS